MPGSNRNYEKSSRARNTYYPSPRRDVIAARRKKARLSFFGEAGGIIGISHAI